MSALFEGKDEEERLNFAFNVLAGYKEQNKLEHYDSIIQTCLDNPEKCQENPSVALCVLVFTTEYRKTSANRGKLYTLLESIYSKKLDAKQLAAVMKGLK